VIAPMAEPLSCTLNVSFHFPGAPLLSALDGAVAAGFRTIELLDPYSPDLDDLVRELHRRGLRVDLFNLPMGAFSRGERGIAGDPRRRDEFRSGVERAVVIAERLGATKVNALVGHRIEEIDVATQFECALEQIAWAAERMAEVGVATNTELLNPVDTPGLLVADLGATLDLIAALGGSVGLQLDLYHLQRTHGDLIATIQRTSDVTRHIQVADAPDRTEPGSGEINFENVFVGIRQSGYEGHIGCEFRPSGNPGDPFAWMSRLGLVKA